MNRYNRRHKRMISLRIKAPLTTEEVTNIPKTYVPNTILCAKCGRGGGTLTKIEDGYYIHIYCRGE